jgi:hypothetical protein
MILGNRYTFEHCSPIRFKSNGSLAGAQTLQDARKPMHTDPQSLVDVFGRDEMWSWVFRLSG